MNKMKNFNYLGFNHQWELLQDQKNHDKRVKTTKGSQYLDPN